MVPAESQGTNASIRPEHGNCTQHIDLSEVFCAAFGFRVYAQRGWGRSATGPSMS
jgi:hypothetical protein